MRARAYRLGVVTPGIVLGVVPSVAGIITGNGWVMSFGLFFRFVAGGDFLILWLVRRVAGRALVEDHPTKVAAPSTKLE